MVSVGIESIPGYGGTGIPGVHRLSLAGARSLLGGASGFTAVAGPSESAMGRIEGPLATIWGASGGRRESLLGVVWRCRRPFGAFLGGLMGPSCALFGVFWAVSRLLWAVLGLSRGLIEPFWGDLDGFFSCPGQQGARNSKSASIYKTLEHELLPRGSSRGVGEASGTLGRLRADWNLPRAPQMHSWAVLGWSGGRLEPIGRARSLWGGPDPPCQPVVPVRAFSASYSSSSSFCSVLFCKSQMGRCCRHSGQGAGGHAT